jgi:hypothetical protein
MRSPPARTVLGVVAALGLLLTGCGQDAATLEQPGPDALLPVTTAPRSGTRLALPANQLDDRAPDPALPAGLAVDLGAVVSSGVNPLDDRPPPPDFVRSE